MADESKRDDEPRAEPKAEPRPKTKAKAGPIGPGDFVTRVGGRPGRVDGGPEPVGRVVSEQEALRLALDGDGKVKVDAEGKVVTEPDGTYLVVTWPSLRLESKHRPDELERREAKA